MRAYLSIHDPMITMFGRGYRDFVLVNMLPFVL